MKIRAAAVQIATTFGDREANLARLLRAVETMDGPVDLVVTPELLNSGYDLEGLDRRGLELAEPLDGPTVRLASRLATERAATVVLGLLEAGRDGRLYDSAVVVGSAGTLASYRKTHLYPPERKRFVAGDRLVTVPTGAGRLGLMICFEHAFPEVATSLALQGAQILAIPSAVPEGYQHLLTLRTRARAQDNQVFAVACNLAGGEFCGRSLIVDPAGRVLAEAEREETVVVADLDLARIEEEREREPSLGMRRPELYR